jgi:hypothetical protein
MKRFFCFIFLVFALFSCLTNHKPPIEEEKIISFYTDYYVYKQYQTIMPDSLVSSTPNEATAFALNKNKLTRKELEEFTTYYEKYPKSFEELLPKIDEKIDEIFKQKRDKK